MIPKKIKVDKINTCNSLWDVSEEFEILEPYYLYVDKFNDLYYCIKPSNLLSNGKHSLYVLDYNEYNKCKLFKKLPKNTKFKIEMNGDNTDSIDNNTCNIKILNKEEILNKIAPKNYKDWRMNIWYCCKSIDHIIYYKIVNYNKLLRVVIWGDRNDLIEENYIKDCSFFIEENDFYELPEDFKIEVVY